MRQVDCGVFPARAEGWNLELLELLSCGKHVITTDYSGHTEFVDRNNAKIVEIDSLEVAEDGIWFHRQGEWAELGQRQLDQTVDHMRYIHKQKQENGPQINLAGIETASKFSWENTVERIFNE
jgi:glycosyltransferase involved in cell wall biosynthesis